MPQTLRNLLGAPRHTPSPLLSRPMPASLPRHDRPANRSSVLGNDLAGQPILHIRPQRRADRKFCTLWSTCRPLSVPLRRASPILETAASRRRVAPQFSRDGRRSRCLDTIWHLPSGRRSRSRLHRALECERSPADLVALPEAARAAIRDALSELLTRFPDATFSTVTRNNEPSRSSGIR